MWSTFRQIGSRSNRQGGGSYNNLFVNNRLSVSCPFLIGDNLPLTDSILRTLQQSNTALIQKAVTPLRNHIEKQYVSPDYIAGLIRFWVTTELINDTSEFVPSVNSTLTYKYSTNTALDIINSAELINGKTFPENVATLLTPFTLQIIQDTSFLSTIMNSIFDRLLQESEFRNEMRYYLQQTIILENETFGNLTVLVNQLAQNSYQIDSTYPIQSFQIVMRYLAQTSSVKIYDSSNVLKKTIGSPDCTYNGLVQYSMDNITWSLSLRYTYNMKVVNTVDFATYLACNVNGPVTLNTPYPLTNIYNGGGPIMVAKFRPNGDAVWIVNIFSTGAATEVIKGIVADSTGNVYVFGSHPCGSVLYITDVKGCIYLTPIDDSPFYDPTTGLPNESNAYVIKLDADGTFMGVATMKGVYTQTIESVFVDPTTDTVYLAGSSTSLLYPPIVRGFNGEIIEIPNIGRAFIVAINNVGSSNIVPFYAILASGVVNDGSFEQRDDVQGMARAVQVGCDPRGFVFALFNTTYANFAVYELNSVSTFQSVIAESNSTQCMTLVSYNTQSSLIEFCNPYSSLDSPVTNNHYLCITDFEISGFFGASLVTALFFNYNVQNPVVNWWYILPVGVQQGEFIIRNTEAESGFGGTTRFISNSIIYSMVLTDRVIYVGYSYTGVSSIYNNIYDSMTDTYSYEIDLTIGEEGRSGSAVVKFDVDLNATLVSNYYTS